MGVARTGVVLLLLGLVAPAVASEGAQGEGKSRPVAKVMTLLKDMLAQMAKEAKEDEEINENMECWCKTNEAEKTKSISDAEQRISALTAAIEEYTGESARLATEISSLKKEIMKNQQALDQATALRTKQLAEFNEEEKDMLQSINSLKSAVISLSKHNSGSLLQLPADDQIDLVVGVQRELTHHRDQLKGILTPGQHSLLADFANAPDAFFSSEPAPARSGLLTKSANLARAPQGGQSAEIFGILKAMKESFETNLATSQKEEATNVKAYGELKAAKETEIAAGQEQATTKSEQLGTAELKNAQSKQDLEDTTKSLGADQKFLVAVQEKCAGGELEYQQRVQTRQLETEAVTKALEFLTGDEAADLFRRSTGGASFLQVLSGGEMSTRRAVERLLMKAAERTGNPALSAVALKVRMDAFTKVKQTMQDMIEHLLKEKDDEIKHKDLCVDELNENTRATDDNERQKADLTAKIDDLQAQLDVLNKNIEQLQEEIKEAKLQLKRAGENREIANKDFNLLIADQRATQKLITASLNILKGFYEKSALIKLRAKGGARQPEGFKEYKKNENAGGVMGMMQGIVDDSKKLEEEAIHDEQFTQEEYEVFVMDSNLLIEDKTRDLINKSEVKAETEKTKTEAEVNRGEVQDTLVTLYDESHTIHIDCDYLLKNFEVRVVARDDEIEALRQGIAMFSGGSFASLAQHYQGPM